MNPYLPGCQCDIYVTRYCVSERVIEIFLAERAPGSIPLAESASRNDLRTRGIILVRQVNRDTKRPMHPDRAARFSTDKISPLAKFIRGEHHPCTICTISILPRE